MRQHLNDAVVVEVRQDTIIHKPQKKRIAALQYVVENHSLTQVTVRLDFSLSHDIHLVFPEENGPELDEDGKKSVLTIDVVINPLQRRHVVYVVRSVGQRAYVRVEYAIVKTKDVDNEHVDKHEARVQSWSTQSAITYRGIITPHEESTPMEVQRWCADINRWSQQRQVHFVDSAFPLATESMWGPSGSLCKTTPLSVTWLHLRNVVDASWTFVDMTQGTKETKRHSTTWNVGLAVLNQDSWVCAVDALHGDAAHWCKQWFGGKTVKRFVKNVSYVSERSVVCVHLYPTTRECVLIAVDLFVPAIVVDEDLRGGLACSWSSTGDIYSVLLQKAYAKLCGSYAAITSTSTRRILQVLTGRPIVQLFPNNEVESTGCLIAHLKTMLLANLPSHTRSRRRSIVMVSFGGYDDSHCAFELVGIIPSVDASSMGFLVRDATKNLHEIISAKLGVQLEADQQQGTCVVPNDIFLQLSPTVFEVLVNHSLTWRRRRIRAHTQGKHERLSLQVAVSCVSLQNLVVRCHARCLAGVASYDKLEITVDRVDDTDKWTRLELKPQQEDAASRLSTIQVSWMAPVGEYVISFSIAPSWLVPESTLSGGKMLEANVSDNFNLLFRTLDQDMDGIISRTELIQFLYDQKHISPSESAQVTAIVDTFLTKYATSAGTALGLTLDDLLQVYEMVAATNAHFLVTKASLIDGLANLVWEDLQSVLYSNAHEETDNAACIDLDKVFELYCIVSSDRDDVILASL